MWDRLFKGSSQGNKKISSDDAQKILATFEERSSDILGVTKVLPIMTFDDALSYFKSDLPPVSEIAGWAMIRQDHPQGHLLAQVFLDEDNKLVCRPDGTPYGRQLVVHQLDKKLLDTFGNNKLFVIREQKAKKAKEKQAEVKETEVVKVSDDLQLTLKGIPSNLPKEKLEAIAESLIRNTLSRLPERNYHQGEKIHEGHARLKIDEQLYDIFFSLDAIRAITALATYKEAYDAINAGAKDGIYDPKLAAITANYIKQSAWDEIQSARQAHIEQDHSANSPTHTIELPQ